MSRPGRLRLSPTMRERMEANNAEQRKLSILTGKPVPPEFLNDIKPKRAYTKREDDDQESLVIEQTGVMLRAHPDVLFAVRQNSGKAGDNFIAFYRIIKAPVKNYAITIVDYWGLLHSRAPFAIECKRPSWERGDDPEREDRQQAFLNMIVRLGGCAGFATSLDEAEAILRR